MNTSPPVHSNCPLCRGESFDPVKQFSGGVLVGRCRSCGLLYTPARHPEPEGILTGTPESELRVLYRPIVEGRVRHFRERNFRDYLRIIGAHATGRRLLDVGCAHGLFPSLAARNGWEVMAVEPSASMAGFARNVLGLEVLEGRLDQVPIETHGPFDAVTFTDSAEYLPDPVRDIGKAVARLALGGILFVKVPNGDYFRMRHALDRRLGLRLGEEAFSPPQRVVHYTLETLGRLASALELEALEIRSCSPVDSPVWFRLVGLWLEVESPWYLGLGSRWLRRVLHGMGRLEEILTRRNHFSPSIYLLARKAS